MTIADWCILAAALLPFFAIAPAKLHGGGYDNARPRNPAFYADGFRARAWGAHVNSFEAFPFFAVAVLFAEMRHAPQFAIDGLAFGYIIARIGYLAAYLCDRPALRTAVWTIALLLNVVLMVLPAFTR